MSMTIKQNQGEKMKRNTGLRKLSLWSLVLLLCVVFAATSAVASDKKVYRWKIQSGYPHGDLSFELLKDFASDIKKQSDGRLRISVFADPEIVPLEQLFEGTKRGVLDMLHAAGAFWGGIVPLGEIEFGIPFGYRITEEDDFAASAEIIRKFYYEKEFVSLLREEYAKQGLYWLDMHTYGPLPFLLSTKPIRTCEDLKGKKIRDEGIYTKWHNMVGARGTYISGGESYMGLKLGTLDICQWDVSAISGMKLHEVAPYWVRGEENNHGIGHILINMKSWNELPDDLKEIVKAAGERYWYATVKGYGEELKNAEKMVQDGTIQQTILDDECIKLHEKTAHELWEEVAKRDAASAKAIKMIKEWRNVK